MDCSTAQLPVIRTIVPRARSTRCRQLKFSAMEPSVDKRTAQESRRFLSAGGWSRANNKAMLPRLRLMRHQRHSERETTMDMSVTISPNGGDQNVSEAEARNRDRPRRQFERSRPLAGEGRGDGRTQAHHRRGRSRSRSRDHHLSGRHCEKSPALLFENIKGHPGHKALYNMIGCNLSRFCLMIGEEPVDHPLKAVQALQKKLGRKMAPKEVVGRPARSATRTSSPATRSTSASSRRSGCGRSTAADISAPATRW